MTATTLAGRLWERMGWQASAALALSVLSLLSATELPALEWLGWFGTVGTVVGLLLVRILPQSGVMAPILMGLLANIVFWTVVFVGMGRLVTHIRRRVAIEH